MLALAHHDGSEIYVGNADPELGETVTIKVRVRRGAGVEQVSIRAVHDGEPFYSSCEPVAAPQPSLEHPDWQWYAGPVLVRNPVQRYRILLNRADSYLWLNAAGIWSRDVSDISDFRLTVFAGTPTWAQESVLYQIFPDRFARSPESVTRQSDAKLPDWAITRDWHVTPQASAPETPFELYGGDLRGIAEHLDYLQDLGITGVYLTPIFPAGSNHRYDAQTFHRVDPLLGGDDALADLSAALHQRQMTLLADLTTNHTGVTHEWFELAQRDPAAPERDFYYWNDSEHGYEAWLGVLSLPKLNWASAELKQRLIAGPDSVVGKWLQNPFNLDGWRIDVAHMTGRSGADDFYQDVQLSVRETMDELGAAADKELYLVAEYFHDATNDIDGNGWHANMNYAGFTKPLWTWLVRPGSEIKFLGMPAPIVRRTGPEMVATIQEFQSHLPWKVQQGQWNMLDSHDTPRVRTVLGTLARTKVAAVAQMTFPGVPVLFAGDEIAAQGVNGEHSRTTMPWGEGADLDPSYFGDIETADKYADTDGTHLGDSTQGSFLDLRDHYRELIQLRRNSAALLHGGMRWILVEDDAVAFVRETGDEQVVVILTRASWEGDIAAASLGFVGLDSQVSELFSCGSANFDFAGGTMRVRTGNAGALVLSCRNA